MSLFMSNVTLLNPFTCSTKLGRLLEQENLPNDIHDLELLPPLVAEGFQQKHKGRVGESTVIYPH
jgi:hypothetical protein